MVGRSGSGKSTLLYLLSTLDPLEKLDFGRRLLKEVGLEGKEDRFPGDLSGGEQQRVAVARALIMQPDYVFADEPTGNLDSVSGERVMQLFRNFNREFGTTIVYVTHDQQFASLASRQIRLAEGRIEI
jgi:putative ABC transport system ATP-binding protein/lipoprotein-releasing system ATP-binding protein